jgi:hypothetical protein
VRQVVNGQVTTLAGGASGLLVDGVGKAAGFMMPAGLADLGDGTFGVVDAGNAAIRMLAP